MLFFYWPLCSLQRGSLNELGVGKKKRIDLFCWERVWDYSHAYIMTFTNDRVVVYGPVCSI